jgi:2'-5' RNA ligase
MNILPAYVPEKVIRMGKRRKIFKTKSSGPVLQIETPRSGQDYVILKKHEIQNSKSETNPNAQNPNDQNENNHLRRQIVFVLNFENLNFEFVSNFVLRASDLLFEVHLPMSLHLNQKENDAILTQWGMGVYKSKQLFYNLAMRIFIGIKLDDAVLDSIEKFLKPFKKMASPVKWTARENLHVTLKFIGEVPTEKFKQIDTLLAEGDFKTGVIDLNITGCGKFGKGRDLNIFWVGLEKNPKLEDLFNRIENTLKLAGIPKEDRQFKPHITAARNKKIFNFKSFFELIEQNCSRLIASYTVTHVQLFESQLTPEGPIYTILKEIPLNE